MGDEGRPDNTEIEVNNENIHISRKFCGKHSFSNWAENNLRDDDPDHNDDTLDNKCRNRSFKKGVLCDSPKLEMPTVNQGPEDKGRTDCSKGKGWAHAET